MHYVRKTFPCVFQDSDLDDSDLDVDEDSEEIAVGQRAAVRPSRPSGAGRRNHAQAEDGEESENDFW